MDIPDKTAEDGYIASLDPHSRGYALPEELETALSQQSFYQVKKTN